jgi:rhamnogalacturonyl hydrolase YesR
MNKIIFILNKNAFKMKQFIKSVVLRQNTTDVFFAYVVTDETADYKEFKLITLRNIPDEITCFINGKKVLINVHKRKCLAKYIKIMNKNLILWENILAFPNEYGIKKITNLQKFNVEKHLITEKKSIENENQNISSSQLLTINYINASRIIDDSIYNGLFYPAFDIDNSSFRLTSWIWCNSILIKMVLDAPEVFDVTKNIDFCKDLTDKICKFQITTGDNAGAFLVRYDVSKKFTNGIIPWLAPNDSAFIATNALLPMYIRTKERTYLDKAIDVGNWIIDRGINKEYQLLVGFNMNNQKWEEDWLYIDSGFTINLFVDLYNVTNEVKWREYAQSITRKYIDIFYLGDGRFIKEWKREKKNLMLYFTRGFAWALDGLVTYCEYFKEEEYLNIINDTISFISENQNQDGSWNYILNDNNSGIDNKSVSIMSYHILRASQLLGNDEWEKVSSKAIEWCRNNINYSHNTKSLPGCLSATNYEGDIIGNRFGNVSFLYSSAYYMLAENLLKKQKVVLNDL